MGFYFSPVNLESFKLFFQLLKITEIGVLSVV